MKKVVVSGASGLIGSRVIELLKNDFEFIPLSQDSCDITDKQSVQNALSQHDYDTFLHLAAYTNVDGAEKDPDLAHKINVVGTKNVVDEVQKRGKEFIYISTDFVFDGESPPYDEDSTPHPHGVYAKSKYEGEQVVKNQAMIVRITYPYRANYDIKKDFVCAIRDLLTNGKTISAVSDGLITPTFVDDIAYGLKHLINNFSKETYHLIGTSSHSAYDAFVMIAEAFDLDKSLIKSVTAKVYFQGKAPRPHLAQTISRKNNFYFMKSFKEGLLEVKKQLNL